MMRLFTLNFVVLVITTVSTPAHSQMGNVEDYAPEGDFTFVFSAQENPLTQKQYSLANFNVPANNMHVIKVSCLKFLKDQGTPKQTEQVRATLISWSNIEIESFVVSRCSKETVNDLRNSFLVTVMTDKNDFKQLSIQFRKGTRCFNRVYVVRIKEDRNYPLVTVERSDPEEVKASVMGIFGYYRSYDNCKVPNVDSVIEDWLPKGVIHDYTLHNDYNTMIGLDGVECRECFIMCRKFEGSRMSDEPKFFSEVMIGAVPVDRIKTSNCDEDELKRSIKADTLIPNMDKIVGINMKYLHPDGLCKTRTYSFNAELLSDQFTILAQLKRETVQNNEKCSTLQNEGYRAMVAAKLVTGLFGRFATHLTSICGSPGGGAK